MSFPISKVEARFAGKQVFNAKVAQRQDIIRTHPVILFRIRTAEASCQKAS